MLVRTTERGIRIMGLLYANSWKARDTECRRGNALREFGALAPLETAGLDRGHSERRPAYPPEASHLSTSRTVYKGFEPQGSQTSSPLKSR
jgi:hypothetical protein